MTSIPSETSKCQEFIASSSFRADQWHSIALFGLSKKHLEILGGFLGEKVIFSRHKTIKYNPAICCRLIRETYFKDVGRFISD